MKQSLSRAALSALISGILVCSASAQQPSGAPPASNMPAAVSDRLNGATFKPIPGAKPVEGLKIPTGPAASDQKAPPRTDK